MSARAAAAASVPAGLAACDVPERARDVAGADPRAVVVAGIAASHELRPAAVVSAEGARPLLP